MLASVAQPLTACGQKDPAEVNAEGSSDIGSDDEEASPTGADAATPAQATDLTEPEADATGTDTSDVGNTGGAGGNDTSTSTEEAEPDGGDPSDSDSTDTGQTDTSGDTSDSNSVDTGGPNPGDIDTADAGGDPTATNTGADAAVPTSEPPPSTSDSPIEPPPDVTELPAQDMLEYFPLVDGATWTYRHTKTAQAPWSEMTTMVQGAGADEGSFVLTDSPDMQNDVTTQWWKQVGSAIVRVTREVTRDGNLRTRTTYDPGFTRFDTLWAKAGFEQDISYTHVEEDNAGTVVSDRTQHFLVLDIDASVTIDNTTYDHCIQIERTRPDTMDVGHYWFAKGIGKIKEVDPDSLTTEELIDFEIP